jgi:hypothetical protein
MDEQEDPVTAKVDELLGLDPVLVELPAPEVR